MKPIRLALDPPKDDLSIVRSEFDSFLKKITHQINSFQLTHKTTDDIFNVISELVKKHTELCVNLLRKQNNCQVESILELGKHACAEFEKYNSAYKRLKQYKSDPLYVEPQEMGWGMKWDYKYDANAESQQHFLSQTTFMYVPIIKSLKSLFSNEQFKELYFSNPHKCTEGIYEKFCCGSVFKNSRFYQENPNAIRLKLSIDDFVVVNGMKSKAKKHKLCGMYMQIENLPQEAQSKLSNMCLVALFNTANMKDDFVGLDDVLDVIVRDISILETNGILVDGENLKGTLAECCFDNLGGNELFGLVKCFSVDYFCRHCICTKEEHRRSVREDPNLLRTKDQYDECIELLKSGSSNTFGIKSICKLNNLKHFHTMINKTVDLMHDGNEGAIIFALHRLFQFCLENKLLTKSKLEILVRDHNYGFLNRRNIPSELDVSRHNLGQNATQLYCLYQHIPFILADLREDLKEIWPTFNSLHKAMTIMYSSKVKESDVVELENHIETHLTCIRENFEEETPPKDHIITHYPSTFRSMGPVKNMWTMRFEAKHRVFTSLADKTNNFVNIAKTLSYRHQEAMVNQDFSYFDSLEMSKKEKRFIDLPDYETIPVGEMDIGRISVLDFFSLNAFEYRDGLFVINNSEICMIKSIMKYESKFFLALMQYKILGYDDFFNGLEIAPEINEIYLVAFDELKNKTVYEKAIHKEKNYIIVESVELKYENFLKL